MQRALQKWGLDYLCGDRARASVVRSMRGQCALRTQVANRGVRRRNAGGGGGSVMHVHMYMLHVDRVGGSPRAMLCLGGLVLCLVRKLGARWTRAASGGVHAVSDASWLRVPGR